MAKHDSQRSSATKDGLNNKRATEIVPQEIYFTCFCNSCIFSAYVMVRY